MDELIEDIKIGWNDPIALGLMLIPIIEEYRNQARSYADAVLAEASTFNAEMEDTFKPSVTKAEFRARESVGNTKIIAEREMKACELLFEVVFMRVKSLSPK